METPYLRIIGTFAASLFLLFSAPLTLSAQSDSATFTSSGNFVVPASVTSLTIEVFGPGGNGGSNGGGGGGGGGYAKGVYTVVPLSSFPVTIATGVTSFGTVIAASGGTHGGSGSGGTGGTGTMGTIANYQGGNGGSGVSGKAGGGGGGAAGSSGHGLFGQNAVDNTCIQQGGMGGLGNGALSGNGGNGAGYSFFTCSTPNNASSGFSFGGGGGGGGNSSSPGLGASGLCKITWSTPTGVTDGPESYVNQIFPNPFTGSVHIIISHLKPGGELVLYAMSGKEILRQQITATETRLNTEQLSSGIYLLSYNSAVYKLVKF